MSGDQVTAAARPIGAATRHTRGRSTGGTSSGVRADTFAGSPQLRNRRVFLPLQYLFPGSRVKKGPQNPIYVVSAESGGTRDQPCRDRSFKRSNALPAAGRALTGLPGRGRWRDGGAHLLGARHRAPVVPARRAALGEGRSLLAGRAPARIDAWLGADCQACPGPGGLDGAGGVEAGCLRSRAAGQRAPPAGIRAGRRHPRQRRGRARGHRPGPPRARPCRPSPPAGPGRPPAPAPPRSPPAGPFLFPRLPAAAAGWRRPPPARPGPDLTRRAERSVRRRGPTDGLPPGTVTAPGRPPATPDADPGTLGDPLLTIEEVTAELRVSRAAFYRWRRQGAGPPAVRLPGGGVRVRRSALSQWLRRLEEDTTAEEQTVDGQLRRQVLGHQEDR